MKSAWVVVVLACVVLSSAAFGQVLGTGITPRALGMGGVGIGVADDAAAWFQNPAGLGALNVPSYDEEKTWAADAIGAYIDAGGDSDGFILTASGWKPGKYGLGAGFVTLDNSTGFAGSDSSADLDAFGIGFGSSLKNSQLSWGVNLVHVDLDTTSTYIPVQISGSEGFDETIFNVGLLYRYLRPEAAPIRFGLLVEDITDESDHGPFFSIGAAWPVAPQWLVAVDVLDITDETDNGPFFSVGAEYCFADTGWKARAGLIDTGDDHDLTLGVGYNFGNRWRVDAAWQNAGDDVWSVGAGFTW